MPKGANNNKKKRVSRRVNVANQVTPIKSKYEIALLQPFSRGAVGAQIPDQYSAPTATYHIKNRFTLTTNAGGTADLIMLPNAQVHAFAGTGTISGGSTLALRDGTVYATSGVITAAGTLAGKLSNYRIVSYGVRVKAITSMTDSKGSVVYGVLPCDSILPFGAGAGVAVDCSVGGTAPAADASATLDKYYQAIGAPYTGAGAAAVLDAGGIDNLPVSSSSSVLRLSERALEIRPKPTSSYNTVFRSTTDRQFGYDTVNQPAGAIDCGDGSYNRVNGMEYVLLKVQGAAATTPVLEVEIIYHLEGSPAVLGGATLQLAAGSSTPFVNMSSFFKGIEALARAPSFIESTADGVLKMMSAGATLGRAIGYV